MNAGPPLLEARDVRVTWPGMQRPAIDGAGFVLRAEGRLGIVGESGSGKSALARALLRLAPLAAGQVLLRGEDLAVLTPEELRARRRDLQMIFQDPLASLDPRMRVGDIVAEPLVSFGLEPVAARRRERVAAALAAVGLDAALMSRRPDRLSGGQAQRVAIARALMSDPAVLVCDEALSALDLDTRTQVLELLRDLCARRHLALVFISHDLPAVAALCDQVMVLYRGSVVETGETARVFREPRHPYTRTLLEAVLPPDPARARARLAAAGQSRASSISS